MSSLQGDLLLVGHPVVVERPPRRDGPWPGWRGVPLRGALQLRRALQGPTLRKPRPVALVRLDPLPHAALGGSGAGVLAEPLMSFLLTVVQRRDTAGCGATRPTSNASPCAVQGSGHAPPEWPRFGLPLGHRYATGWDRLMQEGAPPVAMRPNANSGILASDHTTTLVPLETWEYHSPLIARSGARVDVGGVAEALIYYDRLLVNVQSVQELEALFEFFARDGQQDALAALVREGSVRICHFAFTNDPFRKVGADGSPYGPHMLVNAQSVEQAEAGWLDRGLLSPLPLDRWYRSTRRRAPLLRALREGAIEIKASDFGAANDGANDDLANPKRARLFVQALIDDLRPLLGAGELPEVVAEVEVSETRTTYHWNVDLGALGTKVGLPIGGPSVLRAASISNRLLWFAARERCDLLTGTPLSQLLGDKLTEAAATLDKPSQIIGQLEASVEFPDVRALVNGGRLPASEVLRLRSKSARFRRWLQNESERSRDALIAYHHEVAKEAGFTGGARKVLRLFGVLPAGLAGGATAGAVQGVSGDPILAAQLGAVAGTLTKHLADRLSREGEEWKPMVFGQWATEHIKRYLKDRS